MTAIARDNLALLRRHPWILEQSTARPPLGPGTTGKYEAELAALEELGLDDVTVDAVLAFILTFTRGAARDERVAQAARASEDDAQWWADRAQTLATLMPADRYPRAVRVGRAVGEAHGAAWDATAAFEFGLARVLDGLTPLVEARARAGSP